MLGIEHGRKARSRAIGDDRNGAVFVGSVDFGAEAAQRRERRRRRMSEEIVAPDRDDCVMRRDRTDKFSRRSVRRTVMPDFENVGSMR